MKIKTTAHSELPLNYTDKVSLSNTSQPFISDIKERLDTLINMASTCEKRFKDLEIMKPRLQTQTNPQVLAHELKMDERSRSSIPHDDIIALKSNLAGFEKATVLHIENLKSDVHDLKNQSLSPEHFVRLNSQISHLKSDVQRVEAENSELKQRISTAKKSLSKNCDKIIIMMKYAQDSRKSNFSRGAGRCGLIRKNPVDAKSTKKSSYSIPLEFSRNKLPDHGHKKTNSLRIARRNENIIENMKPKVHTASSNTPNESNPPSRSHNEEDHIRESHDGLTWINYTADNMPNEEDDSDDDDDSEYNYNPWGDDHEKSDSDSESDESEYHNSDRPIDVTEQTASEYQFLVTPPFVISLVAILAIIYILSRCVNACFIAIVWLCFIYDIVDRLKKNMGRRTRFVLEYEGW